jgi:hypothetical protein
VRQVAVNLVMMDRNRRLSPANVFDSDEIDVSGMSLMCNSKGSISVISENFNIIWLSIWAYFMKVIPETCRALWIRYLRILLKHTAIVYVLDIMHSYKLTLHLFYIFSKICSYTFHKTQKNVNVKMLVSTRYNIIYGRGNQNWRIQINWEIEYTRRRQSKQKHNTICAGLHYVQKIQIP